MFKWLFGKRPTQDEVVNGTRFDWDKYEKDGTFNDPMPYTPDVWVNGVAPTNEEIQSGARFDWNTYDKEGK